MIDANIRHMHLLSEKEEKRRQETWSKNEIGTGYSYSLLLTCLWTWLTRRLHKRKAEVLPFFYTSNSPSIPPASCLFPPPSSHLLSSTFPSLPPNILILVTGTTLIATSGVSVQNSQQLMSALQGVSIVLCWSEVLLINEPSQSNFSLFYIILFLRYMVSLKIK